MDQCLSSYKYLFQPDLLRGKVAFITGGGSGIGFTIVEIFLRHGCKVAIASRNEQRLKEAAEKFEAATGGKVFYVKMDIRKPAEIQAAIDATLGEYGRIDILVNNAAGNFLAPITGLSFNAYRTVLEIDTMGTFFTSKVVYEKTMRKTGGVIVNISATLSYRGNCLQAHAGSAKAAIDALTKHMAMEWGPDNIRVIGLAPGPIGDTEGMRRLGGGRLDAVAQMIPLKRLGTRQEMAHAVLFLAAETGSYISGETLVADGAAWMSGPNSMEVADVRMKNTPSRL